MWARGVENDEKPEKNSHASTSKVQIQVQVSTCLYRTTNDTRTQEHTYQSTVVAAALRYELEIVFD